MSKRDDKFNEWYDRQSFDTLVLIGLSPLISVAVVLTVVALIFG